MAKKLKSLNPIIGTGYKTLSTIKDGEDGNIENFPDTLPKIPRLSYKRLGVSGLEIGWEFEDKIYYTYELYGSTTKGFEASEENLMFQGLASSYFYEAKPGEKWYFKARAKNTHGRYTEFSSELVAHTIKLDNLGEYVEGGSINGALIENATINNAHIKDLHADKITAGVLDADRIGANSITANKIEANAITSEKIQANAITTGKIQANAITTDKLAANIIASNHIQSGTIESGHIKADAIESDHIKSNSINSNHIQANTIQSEHIQTGAITAGSGIIAEGAIGSAQISSLDAAKIEAGTIDTSKVTIQGTNGHLKIKGNRLQVFNGTGSNAKERVSLGDVNGNGSVYGLRVRGADGTTILLDENGVKSEGITDGAITNDKISDDANIDGAKLNINSVVNKINEDGTETIQGTKIEVDGTTLNTKLSTITNKQTEDSEKISQAQSQITANTNAIKLKVDEQTYTADKKDMTSKLEKNTSEISTMKGQIALKVEQTDIETALGNLEIGGRNLLKGTANFDSKYWENTNLLNLINDEQTKVLSPLLLDEKYNGHAIGKVVGLYPNGISTQMSVQGFKFEVGKTYTVSVMAKGKINGLQLGVTLSSNRINYKPQTINTEWEKYKWTFISDSDTLQRFRFESSNATTTNYIMISEIKVEKGEKDTDYTTAIEDTTSEIDTKINTAKAEIKVTTDAISQNVTNLSQTVSNKADGSTVTTLSNKVGSLETSVNSISGKVSNLEKTTTTLGGQVSNAQNTADSAINKANNAQSTANTANSTANANKNNITNLQGEVSTVKSDIASLEVTTSGISQKVSSVESTAATLTSKVTDAQNTANSANSKIDNLVIGGANLILGTKYFTIDNSRVKGWYNQGGFTITQEGDCKIATHSATGLTSNSIKGLYSSYIPCKKGDTFTVSVYIKVENLNNWDEKRPFIVEGYNSSKTRIEYVDVSITQNGSNKPTLVNNEWIRFVYTYTITNVDTVFFGIRLSLFRNGKISFKKAQIEKSNKVSDWTPAPEDIDSTINAVDGKVATLQTEYNNTKSKVATLETNLDGITQRVSSTESTTATLTTSMNQVDGKINTAKNDAIANAVGVKDTRNTNENPQWYFTNYPKRTVEEFKYANKIGIGSTANYGVLTTVVPWSDPTGGFPTQTFRSNNHPTYERKGTSNTAWGAWTQVETTSGSQDKATKALNDAKAYTTTEITKTNSKVAEIVTNLDSITQRVSSTESTTTSLTTKVNTVESTANQAKTSAESANNKVDNMSIGGRNLAQSTSSSYSSVFNSFTGTTNTCPSLAKVLTDGLSVGDTVTVKLIYKYKDIVATSGQTASCWIQGSGDVTSWNDGAFGGCPRKTLSGSGEHTFLYSFKVTDNHIKNTCWNTNIRHDYVQSGSVQWKMYKVEKGTKATDWTPAPEDLDKNISDVKNSLNSFQNTVNTTFKDGIIEEAEAKAIAQHLKTLDAEKADIDKEYSTIYSNANLTGSAKTNLASAKTSFDSAHASLKSTINTVISDGRVSSSESASVTSTFNTYNTQLGVYKQRIQEALDAISSAKVDNVQIGGRNLLRNTSLDGITFPYNGSNYNWRTASTNDGNGVSRTKVAITDNNSFRETIYGIKFVNTTSTNSNYDVAQDNVKMEDGVTYTMSAYFKVTSGNPTWRLQYGTSPYPVKTGTVKSGWNKYSYTFKYDKTQFSNKLTTNIYFGFAGANFEGYICGFKLEKGNKATDWSPAPEDIDGAINSVDGKVATLQGEYNTTKSKVATLETNLDGITQRVSSTESTTATIRADLQSVSNVANSANSKVDNMQIGGRNLLKNTALTTNTSSWSLGTGVSRDTSKVLDGRYSFKSTQSGHTSDVWQGIYQTYSPAKEGDKFTASIYTLSDNVSGFDNGARMEIRYYNSSGTRITQASGNIKPTSNNTWTHFTLTGTCPANTVRVEFVAYVTRNGTLWFNGMQLERGTKATSWTPAPEDVDSAISAVDGKVTTLQGTVNSTNSKVANLETNLNGITQRVSSTETTTSSLTSQMNNKENKNDRVIYAKGNGNDAPNNSQVKVGSNALVNGHGRGLNILALNPITLEQYYNGRFDTYGGDNYRTQFAEKIQELNNGNYIIVVTSHDSAGLNYATVCDALYLIGGSAPSTSISSYREAYALIGKSKLGKGNGLEMYIPKTATDARVAEVSVKVSDQGALLGVNSNNSESKIDTLTTRVSTAESKLTKDSLTTTIGNHYTTSTDVNGIVTSKGYQTESQVQQTVNGLQVKVQQSGGYNLLRNSGFKKDSLHWGTQNYNSPTGGSIGYLNHTAEWGFPDANVKCCQIRLSNQTSKEYGIAQTFNTTIGKKYTISFYYAGHRVPKANMIIRGTTSNSGSWLTNKNFVPTSKNGGNASIDNWALFTHTFTATLNSHTLNIVINDANNDGYMWIAQPMIEEGELHNPYSPHPSEVYDGVTTIDKDGVTVTASNVKSKTNMSANGFKITKTDTNEDVFKVNSDGTLYMKGQITVTGGSVPTSNLSGTISSNQLNSSITSDINNAKNNASSALSTANTASTNATNALNTANSVNNTVNSNKNNWNNAYNRVNEWAYGAVTGSTNINGGMIATDTITAKQMAIGDFNNYSQLAKGKNLVSRYGTANWVEGTDSHSYWQTTNAYFPFTVNETLNPFKAGDKIQIKFDAYTPSTRNVSVGVWFYSDTAASTHIGNVTANVSCSSSWGTKTVNLTLPTGNTYVQNAKSIAILINNGSSGERIEVRNATVNRLVAGDLIVNGTITTDHIHTNGLNANVIKAGTISADRLDANTIVSKVNGGTTEINGNRIQTGTLSASKITTGTLDASKVNVTNLNASNITSGTISGNRIASNSITADKIAVGAISVDRLSSNNENPIIKLFDNCSIDATAKNEQGKGSAIRLKWDSMNYILQKRSGVDFYMEPREVGNAFGFQSDYGQHTNNYESRIITRDGTLCFRRTNNNNEATSSLYFYTGSNNYDRKLLTSYDLTSSVTSTSTTLPATANAVKQAYDKAVSAYNVGNHSHPYASSSHSHSGNSWEYLKLNKGYINYLYYVDGNATDWCVLSTAHLAPNTKDRYLGQSASSRRWQGAFLVSSPNVSSDATLKENIEYLDDNSRTRRKGLLTANQLHDFIKNDLRLAEYDYKIDSHSLNECCEDEQKLIRSMNNHQIGFIAQDIVDTEVGAKIVTEDSDGILGYETGNFMAVIAGALQEEIKRREELEAKCVDLEERLIKLEKILESKL